MRRWVLVLAVAFGVAWYLDYLPESMDPRGLVSNRTECDPSYPTVCISKPPPMLTCRDLEVSTFKVFGADPHHFDSDGDGLGCEPGEGR
ncbi:MAG TPA: hypothetical protein VGR62_12495 [Candidatus Binatia bacterium]|jgi:micrococcal nuclease|nr:hypothetical protein [Candidatus Binatia bacterium]